MCSALFWSALFQPAERSNQKAGNPLGTLTPPPLPPPTLHSTKCTSACIHCKVELFIALDENHLIKCTWIVTATSACKLRTGNWESRSSSVAKEVEAAEQFVRPANPQDAELEDRHVVVLRHGHVQGHQLLGGQRMPGAECAGGIHLGMKEVRRSGESAE